MSLQDLNLAFRMLRAAPEPFDLCPKCQSYPFSSKDLRGLISKKFYERPVACILSIVRGRPFQNIAIVCDACSWIVGYEALPEIDPKQTSFVFCPSCDNELCKNGDFISDDDFVTYCCSQCKLYSVWNFDAPVAILITSGKLLSIPKRK